MANKAKEQAVEETEEVKTEEKKTRPPGAIERSISEIETDLRKEIPSALIKTRKQGGSMIRYISWHDAVKIMSYYAAGWSYEIRRIESIGGKLIVIVGVSIPTKDGVVYREATGQEEEGFSGYGDSSSNAEAQALKRAFAKFGLGLHLYEKVSN